MRTPLLVLVLVGCGTSADDPSKTKKDKYERTVPPGLQHPTGTRTCDLECADERAMREADYERGQYSPPPGKDETAAKWCIETCGQIRTACATATDDDAMATCVISLAQQRKDRNLCTTLRVPDLVKQCWAAFSP